MDADQHQHARGEEGGAAPTLADIALAIDVSFFFSASSQPLKQMHCPSRTKLRHGDCSLGVCVCVRACRYAGEGARRRQRAHGMRIRRSAGRAAALSHARCRISHPQATVRTPSVSAAPSGACGRAP